MKKHDIANRIIERHVSANTDFGATEHQVNMYLAGKCTSTGAFRIPKKYPFSVVDALVGNAQDAVELARMVLEDSE